MARDTHCDEINEYRDQRPQQHSDCGQSNAALLDEMQIDAHDDGSITIHAYTPADLMRALKYSLTEEQRREMDSFSPDDPDASKRILSLLNDGQKQLVGLFTLSSFSTALSETESSPA
jgi:hypothetical protein